MSLFNENDNTNNVSMSVSDDEHTKNIYGFLVEIINETDSDYDNYSPLFTVWKENLNVYNIHSTQLMPFFCFQ